MRERKAILRLPINGEEIGVPGTPHLRCPRCREVVLRMDQARHLRERAMEHYRTRYNLLSAGEIRAIRERYRLTQVQLARLLRLGANTISRWEAGRNVQTAAMDVLLRLIRDIPASLTYLRKHAA
jgi:putative zinc finger/helix-turn-helix YgiT family protein